tara:strand:- start:9 stop:593 length:585 start_codon:yes stop_codon:yes gene_type:complete
MNTNLDKRRMDFIRPNLYNKLEDDVKDVLLRYRRRFNNVVRKQQKIDNLLKQVDVEREKLREMKKDLTTDNHYIDHLRETFGFSVSLVKLKGRVRKDGSRGVESYNLCVSRKGNYKSPKNIPFGSEENIKIHLMEYFKKNPKVRKDIEKEGVLDWVRINMRVGIIYDLIESMILKYPTDFQQQSIGRNELFPIN